MNSYKLHGLLTVMDVAEILRISPLTVRAWVYQRRIPFVRLASTGKRGRVLFRREDIQRLIESSVNLPT